MKLLKRLILTLIIASGVFCVVLYTSCKKKKDPCSGVICHHGGACLSGTCSCPTGITGKFCDTVYKAAFANTYKGNGTDNEGVSYTNFRIVFAIADSNNTKMTMNIRDASGDSVNVPKLAVDLDGLTAAGSSFTIEPNTNATGDTFTGYGIISAASASMTLIQTRVSGRVTSYVFNDFTK